jgi:L,D-transpeptidase ErfK/SrfK
MKVIEILLKYKRILFFLLGSLIFVLGVIFIQPITINLFLLNSQPYDSESVDSLVNQYNLAIDKLDKTLLSKTPQSAYLIINSSANEFSLYKGADLIKKDKCSTGSYILLTNGDKQQWMFKTPKGAFKILRKTTAPVWKKPDWAFVEAAVPVPSPNHSSRFEYGVLGDYSLSLGDGYLIHGTLYQRFLGLPVTHGCIRLNDENLEMVYKTLKVGAKVYIY